MKGIYTGTQTASQNIDGIKVSPLEVYGVMKAEGAGYKPADSTRIPFFETFEKDPNKVIIGTDVGLTMVGSADYIAKLKAGGYIPEDLKVSDYPSYTELTKQTPPRLSAEDAFTYVAGVVAYKKKVFFNDFKELYGEEELSKLTPDEESYWTTWYYWGEQYGIAKNALKNREQNYIKVWEGPEPKQEIDPVSGKVKNWNEIGNYLSRHRTDFEEYLQKLELFNYP